MHLRALGASLVWTLALACSSSHPAPDGPSADPRDASPVADAAAKGVFPPGFLWGAATAAHQAESAAAPATDWSAWESIAGNVKNGDLPVNGPDEWDRFDEDFALAQSMGHDAYRFSIEWARIEPTPGAFDEAAIAHYRAMIASMRAHGLAPIATLWHFTLPRWAADPSGGASLGGLAQQAVADAFVSYVTRVVPRFSDLVDFWVTLNEPMIAIVQGYFFGTWPPGRFFDQADAVAAHNHLVDAHARAYDAIHAHYAAIGRPVTVTIASHFVVFDPATPADQEATTRSSGWSIAATPGTAPVAIAPAPVAPETAAVAPYAPAVVNVGAAKTEDALVSIAHT